MAGLPNIAATLGGWSARHRLVAISGWLVLVIGLTLLGSAVGQVTMTQAEYGTGESGRAMWLLADAGIKDPAGELVMVHGAAAMGASSGLQAAVSSVVSGVETPIPRPTASSPSKTRSPGHKPRTRPSRSSSSARPARTDGSTTRSARTSAGPSGRSSRWRSAS